jgi:CheY-like chemotaxis protein
MSGWTIGGGGTAWKRPPVPGDSSRHRRSLTGAIGGRSRFSGASTAFGDGDRRPATGNLRVPDAALTGPILIVDDDAAIRAAISEILESEGYRVSTAADGAAALRQIEETSPALVLLDMRMPGMNGWDVAAALHQRGSTVPILVMTAAQDARRWAEQVGAHGYLAKPFDLDDLLTAVARLLSS